METRSAASGRRSPLLGRANECDLLDRLLAHVRRGESRSLVLRGEAGIGKTALLEYLVNSASDMTVVRAVGVESEMELAYASLHQLCAPLLDRLERLPPPQCEALRVVFGLTGGKPPDRFLVGLGVLGLFSEAAEERPLLCVVDDAQWLDQESALTLPFVARRLAAERLGVVFAARDASVALGHISELAVQGVSNGDARALFDSAMRVKLDERVRDRIIAEMRGNPLALLELPRGLTATQLAGGFGLLEARGLLGRIEESFARRVAVLPEDTRRLLLVAAAEPLGDPLLLWDAAQRLCIAPMAAGIAEAEALLAIGERVIFRHPLVRSAVYGSAAPEDRRAVHLALAEATDREADPDRRAWHLAAATTVPDEQVAVELEQAAARAQARGGLAAVAAFLRRSFALTSDPERGTERALAAAEATIGAGEFDAARRLLSVVESRPATELQRGRAELLRGQIAASGRRSRDAALLFLKAATRLESVDRELAVKTYSEAFYFAQTAARYAAEGGTVADVAHAVRRLPGQSGPRPTEVLLHGLASLTIEGYAAGAPVIQRGLRGLRDRDITDDDAFRWLPLACRMAQATWDEDTWTAMAIRLIERARQTGALPPLTLGLHQSILPLLYAGQVALAAAAAEEVEAINAATAGRLSPTASLSVAAWQGRADEVERLAASATGDAGRGNGIWFSISALASAVLHNGLGQYEEAMAAAMDGCAYPDELGPANRSMVELVEAAARAGAPERAVDAMERIAEMADACRSDWIRGIEARSRALLSEGSETDALYRASLEFLDRTRLRAWVARTQLVYGEWLRRENRRVDARNQVHAAHELFVASGMTAFAERAERELRATGEHVRAHAPEAQDDLTPQERQIAELARDGLTNPEIGARLFLSPRTVEWHLRHVFAKLGIRSRRELAGALPTSTTSRITA